MGSTLSLHPQVYSVLCGLFLMREWGLPSHCIPRCTVYYVVFLMRENGVYPLTASPGVQCTMWSFPHERMGSTLSLHPQVYSVLCGLFLMRENGVYPLTASPGVQCTMWSFPHERMGSTLSLHPQVYSVLCGLFLMRENGVYPLTAPPGVQCTMWSFSHEREWGLPSHCIPRCTVYYVVFSS